jgi:hypothetical protein
MSDIDEMLDSLRYMGKDKAADTIEALQARVEWQPIETAPKDGTTILYADGYWGVNITSWQDWGESGEWYNGSNPTRLEFTYWMPLPEPPGEKP